MVKSILLQLFVLLITIQAAAQQITPTKPFKEKNTLLWTAAWHPSQEKIVVGGDDSLLKIYNSKTLELINVYQVHSMIRQLAWHPNKNYIAIATHDDKLSVFNIETGKTIPLKGVTYGARGIGWNYNGQLLATADNEGLVKIWDAAGNLKRIIKKDDSNSYFSLDWHPFRNILVVSGDDIRLLDTSGNTIKKIKHRKEQTGVLAVRWHPSGKFFVSGDYGHAEEGIESLLQFWNSDGTLIRTLYASKAEYRNIQWSRDGKYLATASDMLRVWDQNSDLIATAQSESLLWGIDWNAHCDTIVTTSLNGSIALWTKKAELIKIIR